MNRSFTALAAGVATTAGLACLTSPAAAIPADHTGCPGGNSGFVLWDVAAEPYGVDNFVDERGNNDGLACAQPTYTVTDENGDPFQIYNFLDNQFR